MTTMRAKFKVIKIETFNVSNQNVTMMAVIDSPFDPDGNSEDNSFARWTPNGVLTMTISNPDLLGALKVDQKYYLDFTEATTPPPPGSTESLPTPQP